MKNACFHFLIFTLIILTSCLQKPDLQEQESLFESLPPQKTGVDFINTLIETEQFNIIEYLYFYNGGGVAAGDINNDGLIDLYFSSNQGPNKLYLNKGGIVYEDITMQAGLASEGPWKTGVTMADINGDGLLDIYVCRLGNWKTVVGRNELYINNGDLTFTESAEEYGLAFQGFSTQAAFFDFDKDGDLDMYLLNHAVHTERSYGGAESRYFDDGLAGDRLYRNNLESGEKKFTGITPQAGIFSSKIGYGLGIGVSDINNDGWPDIYVSNDFNENDYLYINQKDGTFKEQISSGVNYSSRFSMGSDFSDFNNDGWIDFITMDMLPKDEIIQKMSAGEDSEEVYQLKLGFGFERQVSRNSLQLNNTNGTFSEIGQYSGVYATDWSWAALFGDFDNDGWKDLFVTNGIVRRPNDLDYINFVTNPEIEDGLQNKPDISDLDLAEKMPPGDVANFIFKNNGDLTFRDASQEWGVFGNGISNGAVYADLDNDGDLDLVINNINQPAGIYENRLGQFSDSSKTVNYLKLRFDGLSLNQFGIGARVELYYNEQIQVQENFTSRGFQSSIAPEVHFGLGDVQYLDSLKVTWSSGKSETLKNVKANSTLVLDESNANFKSQPATDSKESVLSVLDKEFTGLDFQHIENEFNDFNTEPLMPHKLSQEGPALAVGDLNGDGREDIFIGGASGQSGSVFIQIKEGRFYQLDQPLLEEDSELEDVSAVFFDSNGDGFLDLLVGRGGNIQLPNDKGESTRIYLNDGKGMFYQTVKLSLEPNSQVSVVEAADFNGDGMIDLMIGSRNVVGKYGYSPKSYLLQNQGRNNYVNRTKEFAPDLELIGMVKDAVWRDLDLDGNLDLIVVGEWIPITIFMNREGKLTNESNSFGLEKSKGWWNSIAAEDLNGDGYPDLVVGNLGLNSRLKASKEQPVKMIVNDFDQNGTSEQIISYPVEGEYYTVASKDELVKQMPILKKKFLRYRDFAGKSVEELLTYLNTKDAEYLEAQLFESVVLINQNGLNFRLQKLPAEAQFAPIEAIEVVDLNQDGYQDLILGGNKTGASPYYGAYQGSWGQILLGDSLGNFRTDTQNRLKIRGDVRGIKKVSVNSLTWLIYAKNDDSLEAVQIDEAKPIK
ncbi:VCBS repeat-containing protein [Algoriphagus lutimaris]|uniref:FG-GAP-like repeat-containing protein n=1 Tax=Algoriphagus lutimaris TaxID=613197 RepID=UPI00196BA869|nr:FG-GAP-like repeat-containing protein [Algoriphagus lutimaris]MBN3521672.1 VCBS repeat-containing protein [Algoriphagus lutimaris]